MTVKIWNGGIFGTSEFLLEFLNQPRSVEAVGNNVEYGFMWEI